MPAGDELFSKTHHQVSRAAALRRYLKGGEITLTPDGDSYIARAEFLPLVFLMEKRETPSEGGRCLRVVARAGFEPTTFGL